MKRLAGIRPARNSISLIFLAPALLCLTAALHAQTETYEDTTDVIEVQVPVNVTAKGGEPVRGLTADDFQILDSGKPQELSSFRVIDLSVIEPGDTRVEIERAVPGAARRHFLLLFDLSFSPPSSLVKARTAARDFVLNELHPTDLAAVAMHTVEGGATLLVTFTPDRAQVARAIDTLGAPRMLHLARRDPLRFMIDDPFNAGFQASSDLLDPGSDSDSVESSLQQSVSAHIRVVGRQIQRMERSFDRGRVSTWALTMGDLAKYLDTVPGRKNVVYFSEGFDGRLLLGRQPSAEDRELQENFNSIQGGQLGLVDTDELYGSTGLQQDVARMLEEFRRADCVIQAVDISGLNAEFGDERRARNVGQDALFYIANDTGGSLYEDANDFGPQLGQVLERSAVTYLLAFQPREIEFDGEYHRLKVKVKAPKGSRATYRTGYYAPRPFNDLHPFEKNLLASEAIAAADPKHDVELNVLAAPFKAFEDEAYIPIIIEVAGRSLLGGHEEDLIPVEFYTYVTDKNGQMMDFFTQLVTFDLSRGRKSFERTGLKYYGHLELGAGEYLVRVLVRNADTGRTGVQTLPLRIPEYTQAEPYLLPPFFLEVGREWLLVREEREEYQKTIVYPFTVNGEPYIPSARPGGKPGESARVCLVAYNLGDGHLELAGRILAENGDVIGGGELAMIERTVTGIDGLDKILASFEADGLQAGSYVLEVAVADPTSGAREINSIPFTVVR